MDLHIKDVIQKFINEEQIGDIYYAQKIRTYIKEEMNASISSRITRVEYADGWLTLWVNSSTLRHDLFLNKVTIIEKINNHLERSVVRLLKLL
ncbi:MAG: hypothetical protein ACI9FN_002269 [Saprospiraceae bacterium]|jgi:hypothetical protein